MSDLPTAQAQRLEHWADRAISQGWLSEDAKKALHLANNANPGQLFQQPGRPLVVGLFGGTGVGKSSLLNRLSGEHIARASAERPTSRDITVYVHRSISVDSLPENLPMDRMRTSLHNNASYRQVMFIDMPDFDSVEQSNRELVNLWLPHLDVVMYVVSPERYRDDQGWQLLQRHAREHAWLFVINQWDRGSPEQRDDFVAQLASQGLTKPLVYCTDCADPAHAPGSDTAQASDDFAALQKMLLFLSDDQIINHLQEHGVLARLQELKLLGDQWLQPLGSTTVFTRLSSQWADLRDPHREAISQALQLPCVQIAQTFAERTPFWKRLFSRVNDAPQTDARTLDTLVATLNERIQAQLDGFLNQQAYDSVLPLQAMRKALTDPQKPLGERTRQSLLDALNHSLLNPGHAWQRKLYAVMNLLCLLLPLSALGWISYRVITGFAAGGSDPGAYLNSNFAINGALLLGISWLLPAMVHTWLKPSREQAALLGLEQGVDNVMEQTHQEIVHLLAQLAQQADQLRDDYRQLWSQLPTDKTDHLPEAVQRMLTRQVGQSRVRELDVRANTHSSTESAPLS